MLSVDACLSWTVPKRVCPALHWIIKLIVQGVLSQSFGTLFGNLHQPRVQNVSEEVVVGGQIEGYMSLT